MFVPLYVYSSLDPGNAQGQYPSQRTIFDNWAGGVPPVQGRGRPHS
jgi:hypothetical protein